MTHQETGASPCEEEPGLSSQETSENTLSKDRGGRERGLGLARLCSHWDPTDSHLTGGVTDGRRRGSHPFNGTVVQEGLALSDLLRPL